MANIYVRSTDGLDTDDGSTWLLAKASLTGAAAIDLAGDTVYVSQAHAESTGAAVTFAFAGTAANPTRLIAVSDAVEPPTAVSLAPSVGTTGAFAMTITGNVYAYGLTFNLGVGGAGNQSLILGSGAINTQTYEKCTFSVLSTASANLQIGAVRSDLQKVIFKNTSVKFATTTNRINLYGSLLWEGGSFAVGSATPTRIFWPAANAIGEVRISGVDFSNLASTAVLFDNTATGAFTARLVNCKMPTGWTPNLTWFGALTVPDMRVELHNCDAGGVNLRMYAEDYCGVMRSEATVIKTGGATDGTTGFAWKLTSSANAGPLVPLVSLDLPAIWNTTTAAAKTVTVDILHDGAANLTDADIWLEVQYSSASGSPLSVFVSDNKADILAVAADQTTSTATWTTTGLTTPNKQQLSVTFTPQRAGYIQAKVYLGKASKTVYVDPKLQVA